MFLPLASASQGGWDEMGGLLVWILLKTFPGRGVPWGGPAEWTPQPVPREKKRSCSSRRRPGFKTSASSERSPKLQCPDCAVLGFGGISAPLVSPCAPKVHGRV